MNTFTPKQQKQILKIMARISEASYRRGYQHGKECGDDFAHKSVNDWRFYRSLTKSPWADSKHTELSIERLDAEYGSELREFGLWNGWD